MIHIFQHLKSNARHFKREVYALNIARRDPRVPWPAKLLMAGVVAYAFSPIDLIPDFIPVIGLLDDLLLVPLGAALAIKLVLPEVMNECRDRAEVMLCTPKPKNWFAAIVIVLIWIALAGILVYYTSRLFHR